MPSLAAECADNERTRRRAERRWHVAALDLPQAGKSIQPGAADQCQVDRH